MVIGLAWTAVGGDIFTIESALSKGKDNFGITEFRKDHERVSIIAMEYIKANAVRLVGYFPFDHTTFIYKYLKEQLPKMAPVRELPCSLFGVAVYTKNE